MPHTANIAALIARATESMKDVTAGPWTCEIDQDNGRPRIESAEKLITEVGNAESLYDAGDEWEANGRFISAARNLVPALAAALTALQADLAAAVARAEKAEGRERCWPEDFAHENGNYNCRCGACGKEFIGHKRRVRCRVCAALPAAAPTEYEQKVAQMMEDFPNGI